jgi:hypothetical protein
MPKLVYNEQVKMFANFFNNLGVAALAGGAVIPAFNESLTIQLRVISFVCGIVLGFALVFVSQWILMLLRD